MFTSDHFLQTCISFITVVAGKRVQKRSGSVTFFIHKHIAGKYKEQSKSQKVNHSKSCLKFQMLFRREINPLFSTKGLTFKIKQSKFCRLLTSNSIRESLLEYFSCLHKRTKMFFIQSECTSITIKTFYQFGCLI